MAAFELTNENFQKEAEQSEKPVLIDFWAPWCGPCKMLLPVIESLADEVQDTKICKVNIDEQPELAGKFGINTVPTLLLMENGAVTANSIGFRPKQEILEMIGQ